MNIDVARVLDEGRWSGYQKMLVAGTALTIILDGIDNQLLGTAIPTIAREWGLTRNDFSAAMALGPMGMLIGGALGGWLGDRIGRRMVLLGSVLVFALPTMLICYATGLSSLGWLRFLAGLGLGGAMPNATALAAEYVPRRQRPLAVTLTIVCVPVGAMLAAESSAHVIPWLGWRMFFLWGGLVPLILGGLLFFILPESPRYLASRQKQWPELRRLLQKMGVSVPEDAAFGDFAPGAGYAESSGAGAGSKSSNALAALFAPGLARDTLALFATFFFSLLVAYLSLQLLVTALASAGFSEFDARRTLFWWNVGGVCGALCGAVIIQRFGSRRTMLSLSAVAVVSSFALAALPLSKSSGSLVPSPVPAAMRAAGASSPAASAMPAPTATSPTGSTGQSRLSLASPVGIATILLSIAMGAAVNAVQVAVYALAAHVYPTTIRGTGLGVTVAVGRIGNILASYIGNYALNLGISAYFAASGIGMLLVFISLALVRAHIERTPSPAVQVRQTTVEP
jgi:AAHS family 4-hydroxybenzoate transporter-like MFS transporter